MDKLIWICIYSVKKILYYYNNKVGTYTSYTLTNYYFLEHRKNILIN